MTHLIDGPLATLDPLTLPVADSSPERRARDLSPGDWDRFEGYAAEILTSFGLDLSTPSTRDTPRASRPSASPRVG